MKAQRRQRQDKKLNILLLPAPQNNRRGRCAAQFRHSQSSRAIPLWPRRLSVGGVGERRQETVASSERANVYNSSASNGKRQRSDDKCLCVSRRAVRAIAPYEPHMLRVIPSSAGPQILCFLVPSRVRMYVRLM